MPVVMTRIGGGTVRSIKLTAPDTSFVLFTWDTASKKVTSGIDSTGTPFFNTQEVGNLTALLVQVLAVISPADVAANVLEITLPMVGVQVLAGAPISDVECPTVGTTVSFTFTVAGNPSYVGVQKPQATYGSVAFGAAGGGAGPGAAWVAAVSSILSLNPPPAAP
jgi:hypothetical protein